jgi:predicted membrane channel-forming protein YqfA (hemolysin III family)
MVKKKEGRSKKNSFQTSSLFQKLDEQEEKKVRKLFFTFLDSIVLISFSFSVYFTYLKDYTRTILFLCLGCLLLLFFIVRGLLKHHRE